MRIFRAATVATAFVLVLGAGGCGGEDDGRYCEIAKDNQSVFIDDATGLGLITNLEKLRQIADRAPEDLKDEWQVLLSALEGLRTAIDSSGLKPSEFVNGTPPASASAAARQTIAAAADRVGQQDVVEAANGIEQHAKDVCKFQLGL